LGNWAIASENEKDGRFSPNYYHPEWLLSYEFILKWNKFIITEYEKPQLEWALKENGPK